MRYALLVSPSTNRVYAKAASSLAMAELGVVSEQVLGVARETFASNAMGLLGLKFKAPA